MADLPEWAYVHVHNWARHQHYKHRHPTWIKDYVDQIHNEDFLALTAAERGILQSSRLAYAELQNVPGFSRGLPGSTREMSRVLSLNVSRRQLLSLNHAGLLDFSASRLLAQLDQTVLQRTETETETETERTTPPTPSLVVVLEPIAEAAFLILAAIDKPGYHEPKFTRARFAVAVGRHPVADLAGECADLADWETHGKGEAETTKDGIARVRNWLKRATVPLAAVPDRPRFVDPYDRRFQPPPNPDFVDPFILPSQREQDG